MKKLILFSIALLVLFACKKENDNEIFGTFEKPYSNGAVSFQVQLKLQKDGLLLWQPMETTSNHTASSVSFAILEGNQIRIFDDNDCESDATYAYKVSNISLELTAVEDNCDQRVQALSGKWTRK